MRDRLERTSDISYAEYASAPILDDAAIGEEVRPRATSRTYAWSVVCSVRHVIVIVVVAWLRKEPEGQHGKIRHLREDGRVEQGGD